MTTLLSYFKVARLNRYDSRKIGDFRCGDHCHRRRCLRGNGALRRVLGLHETWPELVLNLFYIACLVMMGMYFFKYRITTMQFNYWCSVCVGATVLLRDVLFAPPLAYYAIRLACLSLSVLLLLMLTYFYARKEWQTYSKRNLWMICIIDTVIAALYT